LVTHHRAEAGLPILIVLAVLTVTLRLAVVLPLPPHQWLAGSDGPWYARQGWLISHGNTPDLKNVGPLYPLMLAGVWLGFPDHPEPTDPLAIPAAYLTSVRVIQVALGALTTLFAFGLARRLGVGRRAATAAAVGVGVGPAFVIQPFLIQTETLFMTLFAGTVLVHAGNLRTPTRAGSVATGAMCALAALTRPILLLFPVVLAAHLFLRHRTTRQRSRAASLLISASLVLIPWHVWLYSTMGRFLPSGFSANLLMGAQGQGTLLQRQEFHEMERRLGTPGIGYAREALRTIGGNPLRWVWIRTRNVAAALAQPHGTSDLGGPSMKAAVLDWMTIDRSAAGLAAIVSEPRFWLRMAVYVFHYVALALALIGVHATWRYRNDWVVVHAAIAYLLLTYGALTVSPRYLFPAEVFLWVLASAGLSSVSAWSASRRPTAAFGTG
jgi:4-amino-4-deoxy-L-arabinose transferase-like glycosyltransferase